MTNGTFPLMASDAKVVENMPFEEYAAAPGLNGSAIVQMRRSPMFYKWMRENPSPATPALTLGTYTHRLILEPERRGDFAVWTSDMGRRFGKRWDAFLAENPGASIVTESEGDSMVGMAVAARKHLPIRKYADAPGPTELSLFWTDSVTGRRMKCRLDKWIPEKRTVADLKTARSCEKHKFAAQAFQLGYPIKMAIQWSGVKACMGVEPRLKLMVVESKQPHESAVFRITPDILLMGLEEADALIKRISECERLNHWPAELDEETDLPIPAWAATTEDDDLIEGLEFDKE